MKAARKWVSALLFLVILAYNGGVYAWAAEPPACPAKAAALIEQSTGRVLYAYNADERLPMASTTKVMTALVVLERVDLREVVRIDERASGVEGSSMYLEVGERLTVEELLYGLLLRSGNDAAVALANYVAGSIEEFARMMNDKAAELGLSDTHFVNPHGLPADDHYTTAKELAAIAAAAMEYDVFCQIVSTAKKQVAWEGHPWDRVMTNKNKILTMIEGGNGIKTGYTKKAGRCLVSSALREDMQLIAVTLNCGNDFAYSTALMNWGFDQFDMCQIFAQGECVGSVMTDDGLKDVICAEGASVPLLPDESYTLEIDLPQRLSGNYDWGATVGVCDVIVDGQVVAKIPLALNGRVEYDNLLGKMRKIIINW